VKQQQQQQQQHRQQLQSVFRLPTGQQMVSETVSRPVKDAPDRT
jgi:hypothetical protein